MLFFILHAIGYSHRVCCHRKTGDDLVMLFCNKKRNILELGTLNGAVVACLHRAFPGLTQSVEAVVTSW